MTVCSRTIEDQMTWSRSGAYDEDECIVEFGDEDGVPHLGRSVCAGGVVFREYGGEDFSHYLKDDDDKVPVAIEPAVTQAEDSKKITAPRYQKRQHKSKRTEEVAQATIGLAGPFRKQPIDSEASASSTGRRKSLDGLVDRLSQILPGTSRSQRPLDYERNNIQNCSFTDLRVGNYLISEQQQLHEHKPRSSIAFVHESDSGSEIRSCVSLETRSDLGFPERKSSWWNLDTLSDRKDTNVNQNAYHRSRSRGNGELQSRTKSVPDLTYPLDPGNKNTTPVKGTDARKGHGRRLSSTSGGVINCWDDNVRRQSEELARQKTPGRSIWKRLTHSLNKRKRMSAASTPEQRSLAKEERVLEPKLSRPQANRPLPPLTSSNHASPSADIYEEIRF